MSIAVKPLNEAQRLKTLRELEILDTLPEVCYNDIVKMAANICDTPIALIGMTDENRQWFKAHHGLNVQEAPRDIAFCSHAILSPEPLIVKDASKDPRFFDNPLVTQHPCIRFYAGFPLVAKNGMILGTLCVLDTKSKSLTEAQFESLAALARATSSQFELRIALMKNIHQHDIIEEQRMKMMQTARLSSLGEMAAGIAHEINNPLSIIRGKIQLMEISIQNGDFNPEKFKNSIRRIDETITRITKIIGGLKTFARDGERDPFLPADAKSILDDSLELCRANFENAGVDLIVETPFDQINISCRSVQISQVLLNLLNNAFDAVKALPEKWVRITLESKNGCAIYRVIDSGYGIPKELQNKIMQPFFTTKEPGKGTGLGLSLSVGIIANHHGELEIDHQCKNTCFRITLPLEVGNSCIHNSEVKTTDSESQQIAG